MANATTRNNEPWVDNCADKRDTFVDWLFVLFAGVQGKFEFLAEIFFDDADVAK